MTLTAPQVLSYALKAGFNRADADVMTVIAYFESGWDPNAVGDTNIHPGYESRGLWQIWQGAWSLSSLGITSYAQLFDPATNARCARIIFNSQGLTAWSTYNDLHTDGSWAAKLAVIRALPDPTAPVVLPPAPVASPTSDRNYYVKLTNVEPRALTAVQAAKRAMGTTDPARYDRCLWWVRMLYKIPAAAPTAVAAWDAVAVEHRHGWYNPPAGVPVFWTGGSQGAGHVALSDGQGGVWSTDIGGRGTVTRVPISRIHAVWGLSYAGWASTLNGMTVYAESAASAPVSVVAAPSTPVADVATPLGAIITEAPNQISHGG